MVGIVFDKIESKKKSDKKIMFRRNDVVCISDGEICIMFRVGEMRKYKIIREKVREKMIKNSIKKEGEVMNKKKKEMKIGKESSKRNILLIWKMNIIKRIKSESKMYKI
jgi:potassium inwardly-rectifying channel subfamily J